MFIRFIVFLSFLFSVGSLTAEEKDKRVIVFDHGGVIGNGNGSGYTSFLTRTLKLSEKEATKLYKQWKNSSELPVSFFLNYAKKNKLSLPNSWYKELAAIPAMEPIPGMDELITQLHAHCYQTAMLSNIQEAQAKLYRLQGVYDLFAPVLLSCEIGYTKPDPRAYKVLLSRLKRPSSEIIFVDNSLTNVLAAKAMGIDAIHFKSAQQLREALIKRNLKIESQKNINSN